MAGEFFQNSILSDQFRVGHKPDPDRPVDSLILSDELCQVNTHVGHIARRQACLGGFAASPSLSPKASKNEDAADGDDDDEDEDASSSNDKEMTTSQ